VHRTTFHKAVAFLLASNYFFFQTELYEEEYEATHAKHSDEVSFTVPSLNWESFDKTNAPKAFVVDVGIRCELLFRLPSAMRIASPAHFPYQIIRDKSPPLLLT
jgi:hypothetical protein